jgi:hypothetical protein
MEWSEIARVHPSKLARLLELDGGLEWSESDVVSILRDQLNAPMWPDLCSVNGVAPRDLEAAISRRRVGETFQDHMLSPEPSVELLLTTKIFAQQIRNDPANPLHGDAAGVIYFGAIAAALARCGQRITSLSDEQLREGFTWTLEHPAADQLRPVIAAAIQRLESKRE